MKHIFIVHSHITYIMSLTIIKKLKLTENDVIFISNNYSFQPINQPFQIKKLFKVNKNLLDRIYFALKHFNISKYIFYSLNQ